MNNGEKTTKDVEVIAKKGGALAAVNLNNLLILALIMLMLNQ